MTAKVIESLYTFIKKLEKPKDDEVVYLDEDEPINLTFKEIKMDTLASIKHFF